MNAHSKLPPSKASRRALCPGSRLMEELYPEVEESQKAKEGTAAHWVARSYLLHNEDIRVGDFDPNGTRITQEMLDGAELYQEHVSLILANEPSRVRFYAEETLSISSIHPECWGTPDCWALLHEIGHIHLWDYKFGHTPVEVFENWQLIEYSAGILEKLQISGLHDQHVTIHMHIVQPRGFHRNGPIRSWTIKASDLRPYFNRLQSIEHEAMQNVAKCNPNPLCNYCSARSKCPTLQVAALAATEISLPNTANPLTPQETGAELRYLKKAEKHLQARITGLEKEAEIYLQQGKTVPYFHLEPTKPKEFWSKPIEEIVSQGELLGVNLLKQKDLITPLQAKKLGFPELLIKANTDKTKPSVKLQMDDHVATRTIFKQTIEG